MGRKRKKTSWSIFFRSIGKQKSGPRHLDLNISVWVPPPNKRRLPQLQVGDRIFAQNQIGGAPNKWDLKGQIVEVRQHDQYLIKLDHSGCYTRRNRKFLRVWNAPYITPKQVQIPSAPDIRSLNRLEKQSETPHSAETTCRAPPE